MTEVAIFGGAFDPPTLAHEAIARACFEPAGIEEVWLMPSGIREDKPMLKPNKVRLGLLEDIQCSSFRGERLVVSDFEMRLPQPTSTLRTFQALQRTYPSNKFWFVFGADSYYDMPNWPGGAHLRRCLGMLVVPRAGYVLPQETPRCHVLKVAVGDHSSTAVRTRIMHGKHLNGMINPAIEQKVCDIYHT